MTENFGYSVYGLSSNKNVFWTFELFEKYKDKWNYAKLSKNENFPFTITIIEKYIDKWDWDQLSWNGNLPWSIELIEKYKDKWCYDYGLSHNSGIKWSIKSLHIYHEKIISTKYIWNILQPFIDDEMVFEQLEDIKKNHYE
jgi:hypothetical protein